VAKGTGRAVFNLPTVSVGCQDEAVVTRVADVAYGSKPEVARLRWEVRSTPRCGHPICAFKSTRPAYTTHPARLAFGFGMKKMLEAAFPPMSKR
jgi:hypothetical protein